MFARARNVSAVCINSFREQDPIVAVRHIRKLGNSRAFLVEGDDGAFYIVKTTCDLSGGNTLANEVLGSALCNAAGLPVPRVVPISITPSFLTRNPGLTASGSYSSSPGTHFGSYFVGVPNDTSRVIELLSSSHIPRITNRESFLGMYLLDIAANHQQHRQAIFVREGDVFSLAPVFIDHGHMFGGPAWNGSTRNCLPLHRNRAVYMSLWHEDDVSTWIAKLKRQIPAKISETIPLIPRAWFTGDIERVRDALLQRLEQLSQLAFQYRLSEPRPDHTVRAYETYKASPLGPGVP